MFLMCSTQGRTYCITDSLFKSEMPMSRHETGEPPKHPTPPPPSTQTKKKKIPDRHGYTEIFQPPQTDEVMHDRSSARLNPWALGQSVTRTSSDEEGPVTL